MGRQPAAHSNPERGSATRRRILDVAVPMIAYHGGRGISLGQVAAEAAVSKTGLLHHFPNKDALLNAALDVRDASDGYPDHMWPATTGIQILDWLVDLARDWKARTEVVGLFTVLLSENLAAGAPLHERLATRAQVVHAAIAATLDVGKQRGEIGEHVDSYLGAGEVIVFLNGLETYFLLDPDVPVVAIAEAWRAAKRREWAPRDRAKATTRAGSSQSTV